MATKKVEPGTAADTVEIDGEVYDTETVEYKGKTYVIRELGVGESDTIEDGSKRQDGSFDGRLNLRLCLEAAIVSPPTTVDQIIKWPGKKYVVMSRAFNKVNTVSEAGVPNASAPPTSGAQT